MGFVVLGADLAGSLNIPDRRLSVLRCMMTVGRWVDVSTLRSADVFPECMRTYRPRSVSSCTSPSSQRHNLNPPGCPPSHTLFILFKAMSLVCGCGV